MKTELAVLFVHLQHGRLKCDLVGPGDGRAGSAETKSLRLGRPARPPAGGYTRYMPYTYQKLTAADVALAQALFLYFQEDDKEPVITQTSDAYMQKLLAREDFYALAVLDGDRVIGGATAYELPMYKSETTELFLYEIGVDAAYRRQGIARRLMEMMMAAGRARGLTEMYVGAIANDKPAEGLYRATGGKLDVVSWYVYELQGKLHGEPGN